MELSWTAVLLGLALLCVWVSAERCPSGHYRFRHGACVPCTQCGHLQVLRPCTPHHDAVCSDALTSQVFHFPCEKKWGLFMEDKRTSFRKLSRADRASASQKICQALKKYRKRIFHNAPPRHLPTDCEDGHYLWSKSSKSGNSSSHLDCRPCSPCPTGTRVMYPCKGHQDNFCSFERINNTLELFLMSCPPRGPTIQVYTSLRPSVSQARLVHIQDKVQHSLCSAVRKTIWKPPVPAFWKEDENRLNTSLVSSKESEDARPTFLNEVPAPNKDQPSDRNSKARPEKRKKKKEKKEKRRGKMNKIRRKSCRGLRRCIKLKDEENEKTREEKIASGQAGGELKRGRKNNHDQQTATDKLDVEPTEGAVVLSERKDDVASDNRDLKTSRGHSINSTEKPEYEINNHSAVSSTDTTTKTAASLITVTKGHEVDLEEETEEKDTESSGHHFILAVASSVGVIALVLLIVSCLVIVRRKTIVKRDYKGHDNGTSVDQIVCPGGSMPEDASLSSECNTRLIVDPLRLKRRPESQDSGYVTVYSEDCHQGSRSLCREILMVDGFHKLPVCAEQKLLTRNAVSTCPILSPGDCIAPVFGDLGLDHKPLHHKAQHLEDGRRTQSVSEHCRLLVDDTHRWPLKKSSGLCSSPSLYGLETESACSIDEGINDSQKSVFTLTSQQAAVDTLMSAAEERMNSNDIASEILSPDGIAGTDQFPNNHFHNVLPTVTEAHISPVHGELGSDRITVAQDQNRISSGRPESSLFSEDVDQCPQVRAASSKSPSPSGYSWSSSTSSSVSIQIRIPFTPFMPSEWLQKSNTIGPENFLSSHTSSTWTQTEDWGKTNLRSRPVFCSSWQGCQTFTSAGGMWSLTNSDVRLEVPPNAVLPGSYVDVTAATYTNLAHLRQKLNLADDEVLTGPLAEFDAGPGFRFEQSVHVFLPNCLPPAVTEEQIKLHHIDKGEDGEIIVKQLPTKREYDLERNTDNTDVESGDRLSNMGVTAGDDIGYFHLLGNGELKVVTKRFCGFTCTICSKELPEPQIQMVVTAKQQLKPRPSGDKRQVSIYLYLWDRKITIADFQRDYLGNRRVGEQTLHVIDAYEDSLVKVFFTINEEEAQQQWKHAVRPGTADPIFPTERSFRLRELLCCHAKDAPRCEEWLAENVLKPGDPCYDFQCFIDVANLADPSHSQWQEDSAREQLKKSVTMFIGDVGSASTAAGETTKISYETKAGNSHGQTVIQPCVQYPHQTFPSCESSTPFGKMEQGPSVNPDLSDVRSWQPLSKEVVLDPTPVQTSRLSDPCPLPQRDSTQHMAELHMEERLQGRSMSYPQYLAGFVRPDLSVEELAAMAKDSKQEAGPGPQATEAGPEERRGARDGNPSEIKNYFDTTPAGARKDMTFQDISDRQPGGVTATARVPSVGQGVWRRVSSVGALSQLHDQQASGQRQWLESSREAAGRYTQPDPNQEKRSRHEPPIPIHHEENSPRKSTEFSCLPEGRPLQSGVLDDDADVLWPINAADDDPHCHGSQMLAADPAPSKQPTLLVHKIHNVNFFVS